LFICFSSIEVYKQSISVSNYYCPKQDIKEAIWLACCERLHSVQKPKGKWSILRFSIVPENTYQSFMLWTLP